MTHSVWFVRSIPDNCTVRVRSVDGGELRLHVEGSANVSPYIKLNCSRRDLMLSQSLPDQPPSLVFNEISDPESHRKSLSLLADVLEPIRCDVVNHPSKILQTQRELVSKTLQSIAGLQTPRTVRCQPVSPLDTVRIAQESGFEFPYLVRYATSHGGDGLTRVDSAADADQLHRFAFDGRDFFLTQFYDTVSDDGRYRKYRIAVVDGRPFLRHMLVSDHWMVHAAAATQMASSSADLAEEQAALSQFQSLVNGPLGGVIQEIHTRMGLDYFGLDCHIDTDGRMTLFEANANMNVLANTRSDRTGQAKVIQPIVDAVQEMVHQRVGGLLE